MVKNKREQNLLFAVVAKRMDLVTPEQLKRAITKLTGDSSADLGDLLVSDGILSPQKKNAITAQLQEQLQAHGGDVRATLDEFPDEIKTTLSGLENDAKATLRPAPQPNARTGPSIDDYFETPAEDSINVFKGFAAFKPKTAAGPKPTPPEPDHSPIELDPAPAEAGSPDRSSDRDEDDKDNYIHISIDFDGDHYGGSSTSLGSAKGTVAVDPEPSPPAQPSVPVPVPASAPAGPKGTVPASAEATVDPAGAAAGPADDDDVVWQDDGFDVPEGVSFDDGEDGPEISLPVDSLDNVDSLTTEHTGRYEIKQELGRGAIGRVLTAFDKHVGREVALKELLSVRKGPPVRPGKGPIRVDEKTARFLAEARITGQLEHPGIVPVYEIARRSTGEIYYTMRMVRGETLESKMDACTSLRERMKILMNFVDLCNTIGYAHSRKVIHRDIKPANVMVGEFGETVVLDWGLAKIKGQKDTHGDRLKQDFKMIQSLAANQTVEGRPIGTPSYMSPEQAVGDVELIDERSDVWSLGAVLYELLTGFPPFLGDSALEVVEKVIRDPIVPVRKRAPNAPPELCAICEKCLQKDSTKRYRNGRDLARDIENYQAGGLVSAYNYLSGSLDIAVIMRFIQRRWPIVVTIAVALVVLTAFSAWFLYDSNNKRLVAENARKLADAARVEAEDNRQEAERNLVRVFEEKRKSLVEARAWGSAEILTGLIINYKENAPEHGTVKAVEGASPPKSPERTLNDRYALNYFRVQRPLKIKYTLWGHTDNVTEVRFSPDQKTLATKSSDGTVKLWDYYSGRLLRDLQGHKDWITAIAFSPDGMYLATGSRDETVKIWDTFSGRVVKSLDEAHIDWITDLAFSPDGKQLATASIDDTFKIWDTSTWNILHLKAGIHQADVTNVAYSPDGGLLASGSMDGAVLLWDPVSGELRATLTRQSAVSDPSLAGIWKLAFSPDGQKIVAGTWGGDVLVWDRDGSLRHELKGHTKTVNSLSFSPADNLLATGSWDNTVKLWDLTGGQMIYSLEEHEDKVLTTAFSPDGKTLASASMDKTVKFWDPATGKLTFTLEGHRDIVRSVAFSPDGAMLATGSHDDTARLWEISDQKTTFRGHAGKVEDVVFGPDENIFASIGQDHKIIVWDRQKGQLFSLEGHTDVVRAVAFSPDGKTIASAGDDATIRLWKAATGEPGATLEGHTGPVSVIAFGPDGRFLVSGGDDQTVKVWNTFPGRLILSFSVREGKPMDLFSEMQANMAKITALAVDPQGKLLAAGGNDRVVRVWDLASAIQEGQEKLLFKLEGHQGPVTQLLFTPDGARLISAGDGGLIMVWDPATGELVAKLEGHREAVKTISLSPLGKILASGSDDKTIKLWDLTANQLMTSLEGEKGHLLGVTCVRFSPDGRTLASGSWDSSVKLWEVSSGRLISSLDDHVDAVKSLAYNPTGSFLVTSSYDGTIKIWPFFPEIIRADPQTLLNQAQTDNGLKVDGMDLILWDPLTNQEIKPAP